MEGSAACRLRGSARLFSLFVRRGRECFSTQRFDHSDSDRIDRDGRIMATLRIIIVEYREHKMFAADCGGEAGQGADVVETAGFRQNSSGWRRVLHPGFERAIHTSYRKTGN